MPPARTGGSEQSDDDAAALRVSSTLASSVKSPTPAATRDSDGLRSSQTGASGSATGRAAEGSGRLPAPSPTPTIGRTATFDVGTAGEATDSADRADIVLASSPPLDIPAAASGHRRGVAGLRSSPVLAPASTSPPLLTGNSPPSPSPPFLAASTLGGGRRLSASSRSGSFDDPRLPGQRRDSAGSRSGSGSGAGESTHSDRGGGGGKGSGSIERESDYVVVDDPAPLDSPPHDPTRAPPAPLQQSASPSFRSSMGRLSSTIYSTLTSSLYTAQPPAPPGAADSPQLPPISEVPYTAQELEEDSDLHSHRPSSLLRPASSTVPPTVAAAPALPTALHAAFRQSIQSVLFDVHVAWTIARCADLYSGQADEGAGGGDELPPLGQRLRPFLPAGEAVSLPACALGLYVKALSLLHHCLDFMAGEYVRIVQDHRRLARDATTLEAMTREEAASIVYHGLSWQDGQLASHLTLGLSSQPPCYVSLLTVSLLCSLVLCRGVSARAAAVVDRRVYAGGAEVRAAVALSYRLR